METEHTGTVLDNAVAFVKDMFGVQPDPTAQLKAAAGYADTAPEIAAEEAMRLNPNAYTTKSLGPMNAERFIPPESGVAFESDLGVSTESAAITSETDAERSRREADEYPGRKTALEPNSESARLEDGE